jgi:hypothetical protein
VSVCHALGFMTQAKLSSLIDVVLVYLCEGLDPPKLMWASDVGYVPHGLPRGRGISGCLVHPWVFKQGPSFGSSFLKACPIGYLPCYFPNFE